CITSPPYWGLRDYGIEGQLGAEPTMEAYLDNTIRWVKEVWRVLKPTGNFVLNMGDTFCGGGGGDYSKSISAKRSVPANKLNRIKNEGIYKPKQLLSVSSFAYCRIVSETDFVCRGEHIWAKPNVPSPIRSRLKHSHEKLFWFVKDADKYYFEPKAWMKPCNKEKARPNPRFIAGVIGASPTSCFTTGESTNTETIEHSWRIIPVGEKQNGFEMEGERPASEHIAPFPTTLIKPYIKSLCPQEGTVLEPFLGSGTTMRVAMENGRNAIGIELNEKYISYTKKRLNWGAGLNTEYSECM
ncbi:MAG: site-specific DNA-methyltransferase, partial [Candidatus Pacebacteria bacterium]|nr:site-specific DNA-methyltransferase [Candidatus Paceibacterota bacterium]